MSEKDRSFLSRWSKRKADARDPHSSPLPQAGEGVEPSAPVPASSLSPAPGERVGVRGTPAIAEVADPPPPPTLAEAQALTPASDFTRFVASDVSPQVKNAALKKLFTDPHFNVMDGLDTYIDDYSKPDPLPAGMLRQMVQSKMLGLFDDEDKVPQPPSSAAITEIAADDPPPNLPAPTSAAIHEDLDLQLQPDAAAGRPGTDPGPGAHAGGEH